jgi:hypothetical protein
MLGQLYFKEKDGYGTRFEVLETERTTFIQACVTGEIPAPSQFPLMDWKMMHRRGDFGDTSLEAVIGLAGDEIEEVLSADYDRSRALLEQHVATFKSTRTADAPTAA